ncbi:GAF and ANTAR domain-containing protein [Kocuria rosea]|uniref:GAF and ANTAR domain-containing protein n=1 Tax=Kocuria rosea TaxID=1275 RepID=UPI002541EAEA|nr:GAF and ANTAR domain-containing protein [Kocuria rosea]WIG16003.1 GAF and ANTAR domain-containing protein [Kocuria rosea]
MTEHETSDRPEVGLQELLLVSEDISGFLDAFTATLAQALSTDDEEVWCAVTLLRPRRSVTVASSSPRAEALDEIQYHYGDGPCLTAAREHRVVHLRDTRSDGRRSAYGQAAAANGVFSVLGVPFDLGGEASAGLNVYADVPDAFDQAVRQVVEHQVAEVSTILRLAVRLARHRDAEADLRSAMESRTTIDLAVGIVMAQNRCNQERAFEILRAASSNRNVKLRDLAAELVVTVGKGPATTHFEA